MVQALKIVVAVDSFKGCMSSDEAGQIIARALLESLPDADIRVIPVADGGEGTADVIIRATGGEMRSVTVTGPFGDPVDASFGLLPDRRTAVIDMASASGIEIVPRRRLNPMKATSFGTGELIKAALHAEVREIVIGIGGSATVDGGIGMAQALGFRLLTDGGEQCGRGGEALSTIVAIETSGAMSALQRCRIRVACDVTSPLLGQHGAARVFGPQKGASPAIVEELESGLGRLAEVWRRNGMVTAVDRAGDGAAGGLGAGLRAFCQAELCSGAELVAGFTGFDDAIRDAAFLVTGEGRTDGQTAHGKLCSVLAAKAKAADARTILISGALAGDLRKLEETFDAVFSTMPEVCSLAQALRNGRENLARTARNVGALVAIGRQL